MTVMREPIEEFLELCWTAAEDGIVPLNRDQLPTHLRCFLPHPIDGPEGVSPDVVEAMIREGLLLAEERSVRLSHTGRQQAQIVVRRHRLAEVLLHSVLEVSEESMEATACQVEHILNPEVTEAVCVFLGHPPLCPHGRAIPRGSCCERSTRPASPLLIPLERLPIGETATIMLIHTTRHAYLQRLSAFGVAPGRRIRVRQTSPTLVVQLGQTDLALDQQAGREIVVRRAERPTG